MQLALMLAEAVALAVVFIALSRRPAGQGVVPLAVALGVMQHLQVVLASTVYVEVLPGVLASPGSAVLFTSCLFGLLVVWRDHGLEATRGLITGLVLANVMVAFLGFLVVAQLGLPGSHNLLDVDPGLFSSGVRVMLVGTALLFVDVVLIIAAWEALQSSWSRGRAGTFARALLAMVVVQAFDTLVFSVLALPPELATVQGVVQGVAVKSLVCVVYAAAMSFGTGRARGSSPSPGSLGRLSLADLIIAIFFQKRFRELRELASRDPLTGLLNRRALEEGLAQALSAPRGSTSVVMLDIDDFKAVNDTYGHAAGDETLQVVAGVLEGAIRTGDLACRFGGDEFVLVLPDTGVDAARIVAERIQHSLGAQLGLLGARTKREAVSASLGVATSREGGVSPELLLQAVDKALSRAKQEGKDRLVVGRLAGAEGSD